MWYFVRAEFVEENIAGKPAEEAISWIERTIHPSLEMLEKWIQERKVVGGLLAGQRAGAFLFDASSNEEVGKILRTLPFWSALRWTVSPLQSPHSALEQDREMFKRAREMMTQVVRV